MPTNASSVKRGAIRGSIVGACIGLFGALLAMTNMLGLLFIPCMCVLAYNATLYTDAGPSSLLAHFLLSIGSNSFFGACVGAIIAGLATWKKPAKPGYCKCSYDLTGNVSGVCPECGKAIENK